MIELKTPIEIINTLADNIERERKLKKYKQIDLCKKADVAISTYQNFIYKKNINLTTLIKIMYALKMWDNLDGFIRYEEKLTIQDIRDITKKKELPKRVRG